MANQRGGTNEVAEGALSSHAIDALRMRQIACGYPTDIALADDADVDRSTLSKILLRRRAPSYRVLQRLADALHGNVDAITSGEWPPLLPEGTEVRPVAAYHVHSALVTRASATSGELSGWGEDAPIVSVDETQARRAARYVAYDVRGACMAPEIPAGARVIVDPDAVAHQGAVVVVRIRPGAAGAGEGYQCKRLYWRGGYAVLVDGSGTGTRYLGGELVVIGPVVQVTLPPPPRRSFPASAALLAGDADAPEPADEPEPDAEA